MHRTVHVTIVWLALAWGSAVPLSTQTRPNVVLIVGDYMGYGDLGPYGAKTFARPAWTNLRETA